MQQISIQKMQNLVPEELKVLPEPKKEKRKEIRKPRKEKKKAEKKKKADPNPLSYTAIRRDTKKGMTLTLEKKIRVKFGGKEDDDDDIKQIIQDLDDAPNQEEKDEIIEKWVTAMYNDYLNQEDDGEESE